MMHPYLGNRFIGHHAPIQEMLEYVKTYSICSYSEECRTLIKTLLQNKQVNPLSIHSKCNKKLFFFYCGMVDRYNQEFFLIFTQMISRPMCAGGPCINTRIRLQLKYPLGLATFNENWNFITVSHTISSCQIPFHCSWIVVWVQMDRLNYFNRHSEGIQTHLKYAECYQNSCKSCM
jgi:hypothetical protein